LSKNNKLTQRIYCAINDARDKIIANIEHNQVNQNLFDIDLYIVDAVLIFDISLGKHELIAQKTIDGHLDILDTIKFNQLKSIMTTVEKQIELRDKIVKGLEKVYERLIEYKKLKNTELVVMRDNKIVRIKPE